MDTKLKENLDSKICYIARSYPPQLGGIQDYSKSLITNLKNKNININLIANKKSNKNLPFYYAKAALQILFSNADIYHIGDGASCVLTPFIKLKNKPIITTVHGLDITHSSKPYQKFIVPLIKKSDEIIAVSSHTKEQVAKKGYPKEKIHIIPNALTKEKYSEGELEKDPNMMITVGRQVKRKGVSHFIQTKLNTLMEDNPELKFYIIGSGPEKQTIKQAIKHSRFKNRINYLGRLSNEDLENYYKKAKFFVMPNIEVAGDMEGFGIVLLEAIHHKNVILANPIEGIADALKYTKNWININEEKIVLNSIKYEEESPQIYWDQVIEDYLTIYKNLS